MKSVHITNYYHKNSGGISTAYDKLLEAAERHKRYVRLIVPGETTTFEDVNEFGRIYYVKANYSRVFDKRYRLMMPWNTYIFDASPIKAILREEKPQIIEIGEKYTLSLMAGLLRKRIMNVAEHRPMLVHVSCERMDDNVNSFIASGRLVNWFTRRYMGNYNLPMFDFHLANSNYTEQEFFDAVSPEKNPRRSKALFNFCWRLLRAPKVALKERVFVNQCGVDNTTFSASRKDPEIRRNIVNEYNIPEDAKLLLYAGRISPEKNIDLLPSIMKILADDNRRNYKLVVAGSGPSTESLGSRAESLAPGRIAILGQVNDKNKLADLFANCDAFIHPNPREPFGITPLEAMASGLPVVAPNSGGVLSYANDKNAWLATATAAEFAAAVRDVFADDAVRNSKIAAAIATAKKYTWEASTDALFGLYDKMYAQFKGNKSLYDYSDSPRDVNFAGLYTTC